MTPEETGDELNVSGEEGMKADAIISVWMHGWLESSILKVPHDMNVAGISSSNTKHNSLFKGSRREYQFLVKYEYLWPQNTMAMWLILASPNTTFLHHDH